MSSCSAARRLQLSLLLAWLALPALRAEAARTALRLESGLGYDSNATRVPEPTPQTTVEPIVAAPFWRLTTELQLTAQPAAAQTLSLWQSFGSKLFLSDAARGENLAITDTHLSWMARASPLAIELSADYYDAFQNESIAPRDFRLGSVGPRLHATLSDTATLSGFALFRAFQYKIDSTQNNWGPLFGGALGKRWVTGADEETEWRLDLTYQISPRTFSGENLLGVPGSLSFQPGSHRQDLFQFGELRGTYVGKVLVGLSYGLQWNDSTSYGYGLLRHILALRFATPLPGDIQLALRAMLQVLQLDEPVPIDPLRPDSFENENRSSIELALERSLGSGFGLLARYSFFTSVLGVVPPSDFYRHLFFLGFSYQLDR